MRPIFISSIFAALELQLLFSYALPKENSHTKHSNTEHILKTAPQYCPDENNRAAFTQSGVPKSRWQACYDEMRTIFGSKLTLFTTSNAARDLNAAILGVRAESAQAASQELWVAGYSYGTYVVNRFLTLFPNVANGTCFLAHFLGSASSSNHLCWVSGALLDGIIYGPDGSNLFSSYDYNLNLNIDKIMADCRGDAYCRSKITSDSFAAETARKLYSGACPALTDKVSANYTFVFLKCVAFSGRSCRHISDTLFRYLYRYALATQKITTQLIPVALYRLNRCDPKLDGAFISGIAASVQRIIPVAPTQRGTAPKSGLSYFINNFITMCVPILTQSPRRLLFGCLSETKSLISQRLRKNF
jgi:hypothetical protein